MEQINRRRFIYIFIASFFILIFINQLLNDQWHIHKRYTVHSPFGTVAGWEFNTSRNMDRYISPHNMTLLLKPANFCETRSFLLIVVCSAPNNFNIRNVIRETWASHENLAGYSVKVYFLLGEMYNVTDNEHIMNESEEYHDILQDRFIDSYNNLTLKSVVMLKIVSNNCMEYAKFLMKTDDDMYVNVQPLYKMLHSRNTTKDILLGCLICGARPIQDVTSKWYAPKYMYSQKVYPNYLSGTGYIMSIDVAPRLYEAALKTPIFHLEDVFLTGILSKRIKLRPRNDPGFTYLKRELNPCLFKKAYTSHHITSMEMHHLYAGLQAINFSADCKENATKANSSVSRIFHYFSEKNYHKVRKSTCF